MILEKELRYISGFAIRIDHKTKTDSSHMLIMADQFLSQQLPINNWACGKYFLFEHSVFRHFLPLITTSFTLNHKMRWTDLHFLSILFCCVCFHQSALCRLCVFVPEMSTIRFAGWISGRIWVCNRIRISKNCFQTPHFWGPMQLFPMTTQY